jgi:hypothetical protein
VDRFEDLRLGGDDVGDSRLREVEVTRVVDAPGATHLRGRVAPCIRSLGAGLSLMHGLPEPQRLELISSTAYADGCVAQVLRPT